MHNCTLFFFLLCNLYLTTITVQFFPSMKYDMNFNENPINFYFNIFKLIPSETYVIIVALYNNLILNKYTSYLLTFTSRNICPLVLRNKKIRKITRKQLCWILYFDKVTDPCTRCFLANVVNLRTHIRMKNSYECLLLSIKFMFSFSSKQIFCV